MIQSLLSYLESKGFSDISTIEGLSEPLVTAEKMQKKIGFMIMSEEDSPASEDHIRKAHGANTAYHCNGTALLTPYGISEEARALASELKIMIWDRDYLEKENIGIPDNTETKEEPEPDINAEPTVREMLLNQEKIPVQAEEDETEEKHKNKNLINYILIAATAVVLILFLTLVQMRFTKAQSKSLDGEYTEAVKLYSSIGWYRGSKAKAENLLEKAQEEVAAKAYMYGITSYHMCGLISDKWHESEENNLDAKEEIDKLIDTWEKNSALSFTEQLGSGVSERLAIFGRLGMDNEKAYTVTKDIYELSSELYAYGYNLTASSLNAYNSHITDKYNELQELYGQLQYILPDVDSAYRTEQARINSIVPN